MYRQSYSVSLNGQVIGYTRNKAELQKKVNEYIKSGSANLLKKNVQTNDDEIFSKIIQSGTSYYKYYVITEGNEEKAYTEDFKTADEAVNELKKKGSTK